MANGKCELVIGMEVLNKKQIGFKQNNNSQIQGTANYSALQKHSTNKWISEKLQTLKKFEQSGSWFSYDETKLGQGRDAVKALIKDNPELADELEEKIKAKIKENNA